MSDGVTYKAQRPPFLQQLREANVLRAPDFHAGGLMDWSPAERGNELAGETGELCNELKKLLRLTKRFSIAIDAGGKLTGGNELGRGAAFRHIEKARTEVGDVLICLDLICAQLGINIEECTRDKFNGTSEKIGSVVRL